MQLSCSLFESLLYTTKGSVYKRKENKSYSEDSFQEKQVLEVVVCMRTSITT